jgi:hypothetical protein
MCFKRSPPSSQINCIVYLLKYINNNATVASFWIITIEDTFMMVLPHDCMDIHMFNKVKKTVNNKEMLLKINV